MRSANIYEMFSYLNRLGTAGEKGCSPVRNRITKKRSSISGTVDNKNGSR